MKLDIFHTECEEAYRGLVLVQVYRSGLSDHVLVTITIIKSVYANPDILLCTVVWKQSVDRYGRS